LVLAAAEGDLPDWAQVGKARRRHMKRVAKLMKTWAQARGEHEDEVRRWKAAGWLHDVLREADPEALRPQVPEAFRDLPGRILHGPAAAERLAAEGVDDEPFLHAIRYHTLGHPGFDDLGKALYAADFLEPKRRLRPKWRARLRERMPEDMDAVVRDIVGERIRHLIKRGRPVRDETLGLWNALVEPER